MQPSDFITLIEKADSVESVEHIYSSADYLFGYDYSPAVSSDEEWVRLGQAKNLRISQIECARFSTESY